MSNRIYILIFSLVFTGMLEHGNCQTGIPVAAMSDCDALVQDFLNTYDIPGATFALAKDGKLVYLRAFGHADLDGAELTQPYHKFRIASVSKPITSIAVMYLLENGDLSLSDKVFGTGGLLENHPVLSTATITDPQIYDITVQQLLDHSAGWDRNTICTPNPTVPYTFQFQTCDPIAFPLHVTYVNGTTNPVTEEDLILFLMEKGLDFEPGTAYSYSNIGYLVLGEIIEEISGLSYEAFIQESILAPLGICDMQIGFNLLENKTEREGEYTGNGYVIQSCYGTGEFVPWEYGGWNLEAMDAHGGWIATARDLLRLLVAVDGFDSKPDILALSTINTMVTPSVNNPFYANGWQVNSFNNWWHTGGLDGTATLLARTNNGYTWAILLNKRIIGASQNNFWTDFDALPWSCISTATGFPSFDLMDVPVQNSYNLSFSDVTDHSVMVSWEPGNGDYRMLVGRENEPVNNFPLDGTGYDGNPQFGSGDLLGDGCFVLYAGSGTDINVTNLNPNTSYTFRVFEYNQSSATGQYPLYKLCDSEPAQVTTSSPTGLTDVYDDPELSLYPTMAKEKITLEWSGSRTSSFEYFIINSTGQIVLSGETNQAKFQLPVRDLPAGFYNITLVTRDYKVHKKFVKAAH